MLITDTYLIININQINSFKTLKHFNLDLGTSLINERKQFLPSDLIIQKHFIFYDKIINKCGNFGNLKIYSNFKVKINTIEIYNEKDNMVHELDDSNTLYDEINTALDDFFTKHNLNDEIKPEIENKEIEKEVYIQPNKPLSEMTMEERISYLRNN